MIAQKIGLLIFFYFLFFLDCYLRKKTRLYVLVFSSSVVTPTFLAKDNNTVSAQG